MAKIIKYIRCVKVDYGTAEEPNIVDEFYSVSMGWGKINEEIAKKEAYNGEYTIEDDGQPEQDTTTADDILNALLGVTE